VVPCQERPKTSGSAKLILLVPGRVCYLSSVCLCSGVLVVLMRDARGLEASRATVSDLPWSSMQVQRWTREPVAKQLAAIKCYQVLSECRVRDHDMQICRVH
jgi:hypothetical protein